MYVFRGFFCVYIFRKEHLSYSLGAALHLNTNAEQILITCSDFTRQEESGIEDGWTDFFGLKRHKCIFHYLPLPYHLTDAFKYCLLGL